MLGSTGETRINLCLVHLISIVCEISGRKATVFGVLLPGFVQNSMQHSCVVPT